MSEPVRSFCARVINLCYAVEEGNTLTHITALKGLAVAVRREAVAVQSVYGGRPEPKETRRKK